MATPIPSMKATLATVGNKAPDRRLHLDDILKLMVADGLVGTPEAEQLARSRTRQWEHPLEAVAGSGAEEAASRRPPGRSPS